MSAPTRHEPQRLTLTPSVVEAIKLITHNDDMPPNSRLFAVMMMVFGQAWYVRQEAVDPQAIAIPKAQWLEICGYFTDGVAIDSIAGVNLGLDWMNVGPTDYSD